MKSNFFTLIFRFFYPNSYKHLGGQDAGWTHNGETVYAHPVYFDAISATHLFDINSGLRPETREKKWLLHYLYFKQVNS